MKLDITPRATGITVNPRTTSLTLRNGRGRPGSSWRFGSGAPSDSVGANGDTYFNNLNGDVYLRAANVYALSGNLASLRAKTVVGLATTAAAFDTQVIHVDGHTTRQDGGEGDFTWHATGAYSTATANGGTIVAVTGVTVGRWVRNYSGPVNILWFGPITAAKINAALVIQNALGGGTVIIPKSDMTITGVGSDRILPLSNTRLVFEPGCTIATGVWTASSFVIFVDSTTTDKENIRVEGNGCRSRIQLSTHELSTCRT